MTGTKKIKSALISVYHKDGLDEIVKKLNALGVQIYSTGGTQSCLEG
jgi:phosphoribosylaminoimidazolecarboxamide formyltransferase/IMP cyclohydrolase